MSQSQGKESKVTNLDSVLHLIGVTFPRYHIALLIDDALVEEVVENLLILLNFGQRTRVQVMICLQYLVSAQEFLPV